MIRHPMSRIPFSAIVLEKAIDNVNKSIVIEKFLLQKAKHIADNLQDFVSMNGSVNGIMQKIAKLQMLVGNKLQYADEILQKFKNFYKSDDFEESSQEIDTFDELEE